MQTTILYILSFLPSFVRNEISALKDAGVDAKILLLGTSDHHKRSAWGKIAEDHSAPVYSPDASNIFMKLLRLPFDGLTLLRLLRSQSTPNLLDVFSNPIDKKTLAPLRRALSVFKKASDLKPCRIHTHFAWDNAAVAAHVADMLAVPFSMTVHANDIYALNDREALSLKWLLYKADNVITISQFNRDFLLNTYPDVEFLSEKIHVNHCGMPTELFSPLDFSGLHRDVFRIVTLPSGFKEKKGLSVLFHALKELKDEGRQVECAVIGGDYPDSKRTDYEREAQELGISSIVDFIGLVPQTELMSVYQKSDVFVLPCVVDSKGKMDGIPVSLMEAIAVGLPVVSTRISGIPELIEHDRTGLLARPGDPLDLAHQIKRVMDKKVNIPELTKAARAKTTSEFNSKINAREFASILGLKKAARQTCLPVAI